MLIESILPPTINDHHLPKLINATAQCSTSMNDDVIVRQNRTRFPFSSVLWVWSFFWKCAESSRRKYTQPNWSPLEFFCLQMPLTAPCDESSSIFQPNETPLFDHPIKVKGKLVFVNEEQILFYPCILFSFVSLTPSSGSWIPINDVFVLSHARRRLEGKKKRICI